MDGRDEAVTTYKRYPCTDCGAELQFKPGTTHLNCQYCGANNHIDTSNAEPVKELDYHAVLNNLEGSAPSIQVQAVKCTGCGSTTTIQDNIQSSFCAFCGTPLVMEQVHSEAYIKPKSLLPFKITKKDAKISYKKWIKGKWFAPNDLKRSSQDTRFKGVYLPYWTYDSDTDSDYRGERGEYYYVTETYTAVENGKSVTKTRQVRKTRWYPASGRILHFFDDVLIVATTSLPLDIVNRLKNWDLQELVPFTEDYLSGYVTERYQVNLDTGFGEAKEVMRVTIYTMVRKDIGGDEQKVHSVDTKYDNITFKHILLPLYISAFRYGKKTYQFMVNARTGQVAGNYPISKWKVAFVVILALLIIGLIVYFANQNQG